MKAAAPQKSSSQIIFPTKKHLFLRKLFAAKKKDLPYICKMTNLVGFQFTCFLLSIVLFSGCATLAPEYISKTAFENLADVADAFHGSSAVPNNYKGIKIVPHQPDIFYEQNVPYCGGFSIAAVLSAYEIQRHQSIGSYMSNMGRLIGGMSPKGLIRTLRANGIEGEIHRCIWMADSERINILRQEIDQERPVLLLIGNGHEKCGIFSNIRSQGISHLHWITIWGYHDDGFFIYDSVAHPYQYERIPAGNIERSSNDLLRDWSRPFYLIPFTGYTLYYYQAARMIPISQRQQVLHPSQSC
jgi:hypothetical protein